MAGGDPAAAVGLLHQLSTHAWGIGALFFGLWLIPMGWAAVTTRRFPVALGWVLIVGGVGYLLSALVDYALASPPGALVEGLAFPATIGEFWMIGYLLIRGIRPETVPDSSRRRTPGPGHAASRFRGEASRTHPTAAAATATPRGSWSSVPLLVGVGPHGASRGRRPVCGSGREDDMVRQLLVILALGLGAAVPASAPASSIDGVIDAEMPASGVPGLAYAVVADGEVTSVGARGVARLGSEPEGHAGHGVRDRLDLQELHGAGRDATGRGGRGRAGRPGLAATSTPSPAGRPARSRSGSCSHHTSGWSTLQGNTSPADITGGRDELARRVDRLATMTPAHAPDVTWEYSNTNYEILGRVIEVVAGQDVPGLRRGPHPGTGGDGAQLRRRRRGP